MRDEVLMADGTVLLNVHTAAQCQPHHCCIHNPSNHHMKVWPYKWDSDFKQMWRQCPHGFIHPDPDDLQFRRGRDGDASAGAAYLHDCDACCQPVAMLPPEISAKVDEFLANPSIGTVATRPPRPPWRLETP